MSPLVAGIIPENALGWLGAGLALGGFLIAAALLRYQTRTLDEEADRFRERLGTAEDLERTLASVMREYHSQGLAQAKVSFRVSLAFAAIGFVVILTAIGISLNSQSPGLGGDATISLIAGTVIEAVASLFFVLSNNARRTMESFFDKLRTDRKLEEALKLTSEMKDPQMQAALQAVLALGFAGSKVHPTTLPGFGFSSTDEATSAELVGGDGSRL
jgi:hypothetical protein